MARRVEDHAAINDAHRVVHSQAQPFEHRREMPGIDELAVNPGLTAYGFEPNAIEERRQQGMPVEGLIQSSDRPRRALKTARERGIDAYPGGGGPAGYLIEHGFS